ncbi:MAG: DUF1549 and DUF1553 domain-containing protein [Gemmataceae bacterium]|jgi:hypothetical protein|nr:DUF1549 and DUF1553 domain-containing protein [Gemmataceae bacterium]
MRLAFLFFLFLTSFASAQSPSFRHEVIPVLTRAGCNQGACHGNLNGKGGLKLSLRGEDPLTDRAILTRDSLARRVSVSQPEESLILKKAVGAVPHEGGPRFSKDSLDYAILKKWIAAGCPDDSEGLPKLKNLEVSPREHISFGTRAQFDLTVVAHFSDGSQKDVRALAVYEPTVLGVAKILNEGQVRKVADGELNIVVRYLDKQVPVPVYFLPERTKVSLPLTNHVVDQKVHVQLERLRITPAPIADDSMFLRRVYLDILGVLPSAEEARRFLNDATPTAEKRSRLIDELLTRPEFAEYMAQKWGDLLRNEEKSLDRKGVRAFQEWLRQSFRDDKPLNEIAREILSAKGSSYANPATSFYRAIREPYARAEAVAQVFLGIRIGCAKCHNHPFDRWTQDDYHEFAAHFGRIDYRILNNSRRDQLDSHEFDGEQIVYLKRQGGLKHPRTGQVMSPRVLDATTPISPEADPLESLANWVADPKNPFFAKAQVNRVWYHLFGKGLVEPNDDFRATNPPVNAELIEVLTQQFIQQGFDLRKLIKLIVSSETYQRSSLSDPKIPDEQTHFSRAFIQPLEAEQLLDAVSSVLQTTPKFYGYPKGTRAGQLAALPQDLRRTGRNNMAEKFLKSFGKPERLLTCECERSDDMGLSQTAQLIAGELVNSLLTEPENRLGKMLDQQTATNEMIETLFLAALTRKPTPSEAEKLGSYLDKASNRRQALEDIAWGLINSKEFLLRR